MTQHFLSGFFEPKSVVVFGASERPGAVGMLVFQNMLESFQGKVYAINSKHSQIQGQPAFPNLDALDEPVDLAVIATPAAGVPGIIEQCGVHGIKNAIILSAGFREAGPQGVRLERMLMENARRYNLRFIGPNCLGVMRPSVGLNATFNKGSARSGQLALVSQSGAICTAILDWAAAQDIGFSTVVSMGISADADFGEILDYLVNDPKTSSILLYIEGVHNARSFMSGLRAAARVKPVIAIKVGRHATGSKAVMSHTGALVGADDVFDTALSRAGVVRGTRITNLFSAATALTAGFRLQGERLAIITNGGGPGVMATDRAADLNIPLAELSTDVLAALNQFLPTTWSHSNPLDIIGDATPDRYAHALEICLKDDGVDGVMVILTPQAMTDPTGVAEEVARIAMAQKKPVFACWMGHVQVEPGREVLRNAGVPTYHTPETVVEAFAFLVAHYRNQNMLLQTPGAISRGDPPDAEGARMIIEGALSEGRTILSESESKAVLGAFHIRTAQAVVVHTPTEALVQAEIIGMPVALKVNSPDITHKSDVGGVRLGLSSAQAVRSAYLDLIETVKRNRPDARIEGLTVEPMLRRPNGREILVGITRDDLFGPVVTFGAGGTAVEALADRAVTLPPLNKDLAREVIGRTRIAKTLGKFRQIPPVHMESLEKVLLRVSEIACELPLVKELDINPLIVDETGAIAVDARIVVGYHSGTMRPYDHMAIHPYPHYLVSHWQLPDGTDVTIRPISPEDAKIGYTFVHNLSVRSKYFRFMQSLEDLTPAMLARFTQIDYDREMALIATVQQNGQEIEIGVTRYTTNPDGKTCEMAIVVADDWQRRGIGHHLLERLMSRARDYGLEVMEGNVIANNDDMLRMVERHGFAITEVPDDALIRRIHKQLR
ncbi:acetyltransferase [Gammaproteobacteria bacterium]